MCYAWSAWMEGGRGEEKRSEQEETEKEKYNDNGRFFFTSCKSFLEVWMLVLSLFLVGTCSLWACDRSCVVTEFE